VDTENASEPTPRKRNTKRVSPAIAQYTFLECPVGRLLLAGADDVLMLINFPTGSQALKPRPGWVRDDCLFADARRQLREYFEGGRTEFTMPLEMDGTDFQKDVWTALRRVPFGATVSYGELAQRIGRPKAGRAVGAANHANPLPIVVPCHRVIGSDRSLTGFGGGLETKRKLLEFENPAGFAGDAQHDLFPPASGSPR
jgi:methylated-DNA-[protein]-cysteine S-methyltransferase